jgi:mono/diheme cytochrome c family protein
MGLARSVAVGMILLIASPVTLAGDSSILTSAEQQRARVNFLLHCAACHLPDGHGSPGTVPDLHEYLGEFAQHPDSRSFIARVPGASGAPVNNAELAQVLNWVLITMNGDQLRPGFKPYTAEEVAGYRRDTLIDVAPERQALIKKLAAGTMAR